MVVGVAWIVSSIPEIGSTSPLLQDSESEMKKKQK